MFLNLGNSIKLEVLKESVARIITWYGWFSSPGFTEKSGMGAQASGAAQIPKRTGARALIEEEARAAMEA